MNGEETLYKVNRTSRLSKLFYDYATRKGVHKSHYDFMLDGELIVNYNSTLWALGVKDGRTIDATQSQRDHK